MNLSAAEEKVKFRNIRTAYGRYEADNDFAQGLKEEINLLGAKFPPQHLPCCLLRFSRQHNAHVILTLPLTEQSALRSSAIIWKQLSLRSAIVCNPMETSL